MGLTLVTWNWWRGPALALAAACGAGPACATEGAPALDGSTLGLWWALPFAGLLLSVAVVPQLSPHFWHRHFGKVAAAWALLFLLPFAATYGIALAAGEGGVSPNPRKFRQAKSSPAAIAFRSMIYALPRKVYVAVELAPAVDRIG